MKTLPIGVYLEIGKKRTFAGALEWPGWCRSGRHEDAALDALVDAAPRYVKALGRRKVAGEFTAPARVSSLRVVERLKGNATTDFGAPGIPPAADDRPLDDAETKRQIALLQACWAAFDRAAKAAVGKELRKGPRGGGRELDAIVSHVMGADAVYLAQIGERFPIRDDQKATPELAAGLRSAIVEALWARVRGEPPGKPRRSGTHWPPRYFVRRSAWHALDHAWEIEDRAAPPGGA
ncbi:MAG: hypothetical protein M3Q23_07540 [Actinomycetota bacterium]|nr:hypothetical protein [Actinomycetota bacterium]